MLLTNINVSGRQNKTTTKYPKFRAKTPWPARRTMHVRTANHQRNRYIVTNGTKFIAA
jgi:hypothetical protein